VRFGFDDLVGAGARSGLCAGPAGSAAYACRSVADAHSRTVAPNSTVSAAAESLTVPITAAPSAVMPSTDVHST